MVQTDATATLNAVAETAERFWLRPLGLLSGTAGAAAIARGIALPLAGGSLAFALVEIISRGATAISSAVAPLMAVSSMNVRRCIAATSIDPASQDGRVGPAL